MNLWKCCGIGGLDTSPSHNAVAFAEHNNTRFPFGSFLFAEARKTQDCESVALLAEPCDGTVENNLSRTALAGNGISFKSVPVGCVAAQDVFVGLQTSLFHQVRSNGEAALVVNVTTRNRGAMNFRLKQKYLHCFDRFQAASSAAGISLQTVEFSNRLPV